MMELIACSTYFLVSDPNVIPKVGLDPSSQYACAVIISRRSKFFLNNTITLDVSGFFELMLLANKIVTSNLSQLDIEYEDGNASACKVGDYIVSIDREYDVIRFSRKLYLFLQEPEAFELSFETFSEIFNLRITLQYKLSHIGLYSDYACFTHGRIINFLVNLILRDENVGKIFNQGVQVPS